MEWLKLAEVFGILRVARFYSGVAISMRRSEAPCFGPIRDDQVLCASDITQSFPAIAREGVARTLGLLGLLILLGLVLLIVLALLLFLPLLLVLLSALVSHETLLSRFGERTN